MCGGRGGADMTEVLVCTNRVTEDNSVDPSSRRSRRIRTNKADLT